MKHLLSLLILSTFICLQHANAQVAGNSLRILADNNYVSVPDPSSNLINNTMTLEAWVYYECENTATGSMIVSKGWCSVPDYSFYFNVVGQRLRFKKIRNGTGGCSTTADPIWETTDEVIPFNTWVHVALVIDATTSNTSLAFYVDGVLAPHTLLQGTDGLGYNASPYPWLLGSSRNINNLYRSLSGNLDEVRVWHTLRTQAQIQANKDVELVGNEIGLQAYWKLNETGSGPGITTLNSATLTGATFNGSSVGTAANVFFIHTDSIPNKLPTCNPVLWLKADKGVTFNSNHEVNVWNDQSGLNNHATMPNVLNQPKFKANEINNKPIIRFDGVNDYLVTPSINLSSVQAAEVFYVLKSRDEGFVLVQGNSPTLPNSFSIIENYSDGTNGHSALLNGNSIDQVKFKSTTTDSCYHIMNVQYNKALLSSNQVKLFRNQIPLSNTNGSIIGTEMVNNLGNASMTIGGTSTMGFPFLNADIAEIIVYNKILSNYERTTMYAYLNTKYLTNKVSTQFTTISAASTFSNEICDDDVWRHSFNSAQPNQVLTSVKSNCLTFDQRSDSVFVEPNAVAYAGTYFMRRHFVINPTVELSGTKTVRLYYSLADFTDLQNYVTSLVSHAQLSIIQYDGLNEDGIYDPTGGNINFISSAQITHGTAYGMYYLQFDVSHFSEFWIQVGNIPLAIQELKLNVFTASQGHQLSWNCVGCEDVVSFAILESSDEKHYKTILQQSSTVSADVYKTTVSPSNNPLQYFVVEAENRDGTKFRSNTSVIKNKNNLFQLEAIYASQSIQILSNRPEGKIKIYTMSGQKLLEATQKIILDKHTLAPGIYFALLSEMGTIQHSIKFVVN